MTSNAGQKNLSATNVRMTDSTKIHIKRSELLATGLQRSRCLAYLTIGGLTFKGTCLCRHLDRVYSCTQSRHCKIRSCAPSLQVAIVYS